MSASQTMYISTDPMGIGRKFWFILRIYETTEQLQDAAHAYRSYEDFSQAGGVFHGRFSSWRDKKTGRLTEHPSTSFIGVMRLSREYLEPHVVIHESVHAAVTLVQAMRLVTEIRLGKTNHQMDRYEEPLCHATHEIADAVLKADRPDANRRSSLMPETATPGESVPGGGGGGNFFPEWPRVHHFDGTVTDLADGRRVVVFHPGPGHTSEQRRPEAMTADELRVVADDKELLEVGRRAVEDALIESRDMRLSIPFRNNGLVVKESDGSPSDIIRMGPEEAMRIGLRAIADHLAVSKPTDIGTQPPQEKR